MRYLVKTTALAAALALTASAGALARGFEAKFEGPVTGSIGAITTKVAEDRVGYEKVRPSRDSDFKIGPRDADRLAADLKESLSERLAKAGALAPQEAGAAYTLDVVILDATPDNPGFTENGQRRNVSAAFSSGRGGAKLEAVLVAADGSAVATFTYDWDEGNDSLTFAPASPWYNAERAFDRFAIRVAKALETGGSAGY